MKNEDFASGEYMEESAYTADEKIIVKEETGRESPQQVLQPDIFFVTFCAVATLPTHKMRQALRARKYRLS